MDYNKLIRLLESNGFILIRCSKHLIYSNGKQSVSVPKQHKNVNKFVARKILKTAGILEDG